MTLDEGPLRTVSTDAPAAGVTPPWHHRPMNEFTFHVRGDVIDRRRCPTCDAVVIQRYRPGRARVYCTHACRQRAYRWRRRNGIRTCVERTGPATRGHAFARSHALRDPRDRAATTLVDHRGRRLTVCGTFVRPADLVRYTHVDFLPRQPWSCDVCSDLIGAPDEPEIPDPPPFRMPTDALRRPTGPP